MSMEPLGMIGSIAGTPLAQAKVSQRGDAAPSVRQPVRLGNSANAEGPAEGVGEIEQDSKAHDRDPDGRYVWQRGRREQQPAGEQSGGRASDPSREDGARTDEIGGTLDLLG